MSSSVWIKRGLSIVGVLSGIVILLLIWGIAVEPRFLIDVKREDANIPNLPSAWDGRQIAVIADMQIGMWLDNERATRRIVDRIVDEQPAVVLIGGDFVYQASANPEAHLRVVSELLQPLSDAGIPTYAVLGNHDYGVAKDDDPVDEALAQRVTATVERLGIEVLQNEAVPLVPSGSDGATQPAETLYLVGIGAYKPEKAQPMVALRQVPDDAPRIVLMHHPDTFALLPPETAPLALAGHTHGGQIRIPGLPQWTWLTFTREEEVHADGWIDGFGHAGNRLYVNRGIGFSVFPIRINCRPELTLMTVHRSETTTSRLN